MDKEFLIKQYLKTGSFEHEGFTLPYRWCLPRDYDPAKKYPLVLFLHGAGERGTDNELSLKHMIWQFYGDDDSPIYGAIVLAPQCPRDMRWAETDWSLGSYSRDDETIPSPAMRAAIALVENTIEEYSVDKEHVYVMGLSMGGFGTWYVLEHRPDIFAGGIPVCGGGNPSLAYKAAPLAIHAFHSSDDNAVPVEGSRTMVKALKDAGCKRIRYTEYNYTGHGSWVAAADTPGLLEWLFAQKREEN